ncbi:YaaR family protein [Pelosinus sp. sgz500959]|uniref:YaaR family protein n=1 Tax=Pelosinus sp. sgz500959 TaxID=3242472 RepID=UPI00366F992A
MKINTLGTAQLPNLPEREVGARTDKSLGHFASDLLKNQDGQSRERMTELLKAIDYHGKQLGETPTYSELKQYREVVRQFVGEAVGRMYSLSSQQGWDRSGRQKVYTIIKKVDATLESLSEDVRQGQERNLNIIAKHDALRGMLVDLFM